MRHGAGTASGPAGHRSRWVGRGGRARAVLSATVVLAATTLGASSAPADETQWLVQVRFPSLAAVDAFLLAHPETQVRTERRIVRPELALSASAFTDLQTLGYPYRVVFPGADEDREVANAPPPHTNQKTSDYFFQEHVDTLDALAARYPGLTRHIFLGTSVQGRPIHAMKISANPDVDEDEPTVLLVGVHHADEGIGVDITLRLATELLSAYGLDAVVTSYLDNYEIWIVPLLNPDGWMLLESQTLRAWRKNARDNDGDNTFETLSDGVDLNRNYDFNWELGIADPSAFTYRGPYPFSEPETACLRDLILETKPSLALTYHQHGDVIIIPWTSNGAPTPDSLTYRAIASELASSTTRLDGTPYDWYEDSDTAGYMDDWVYGACGGFCFTVEVTTTDKPSIAQAVDHNLGGAFDALARLGGPQITGRVTSLGTGQPLEAELEVLEIDTSQLLPRRSDPATGRYRRLLVPGAYTLHVHAPGYFSRTLPVAVGAVGPAVVDVALEESTTVAAVGSHPEGWRGLQLASHPNPTRHAANVRFFLPRAGAARLAVYDLSGRRVRNLMDGHGQPGWSTVAWNGRDDAGTEVPAGVYVLRLMQGGDAESRRVAVLK